MENQDFVTTNINDLWMKNIFENLEKAESYERIARQGCETPEQYMMLPPDSREYFILQNQFKHLSFLHSELLLCLTDSRPVLEAKQILKHENELKHLENSIRIEKYFIKIMTDASNKIIRTYLTDHFYKTLEFLSQVRQDIISTLSPLLFVKKPKQTW